MFQVIENLYNTSKTSQAECVSLNIEMVESEISWLVEEMLKTSSKMVFDSLRDQLKQMFLIKICYIENKNTNKISAIRAEIERMVLICRENDDLFKASGADGVIISYIEDLTDMYRGQFDLNNDGLNVFEVSIDDLKMDILSTKKCIDDLLNDEKQHPYAVELLNKHLSFLFQYMSYSLKRRIF